MLNAIKMDLYRLGKSKSIYIILALTAAMMLLSMYIISVETKIEEAPMNVENKMLDISVGKAEEVPEGVALGIEVPSLDISDQKVSTFEFFSINVQSSLLVLFLCIFTVIFVNADTSTGYVKNTANHVPNCWNLILSKLLSIAVATVLLFFVAFLAIVAGSALFWGYVNFEVSTLFFQFVGVQLFLHIAFGAFTAALTIALKNTAASMAIGIFIVIGMPRMLYELINKVLENTFSVKDIDIGKYDIMTNIGMISKTFDTKLYTNGIVVAVAFILLASIVSIWIFEKRDI